MSTLIIINNTAAKARHVWPKIEAKLNATALEYDLYETKAAGDATTKTRAALRSGVTNIAVIGGDGTLGEVAEGFFEFDAKVANLPKALNPEATLAILPAGTGDDFARGLRGKRVPLSNWLETFLAFALNGDESHTITVDVLYGLCDGYHTPFICLNASTMGIGGETAKRVAAQGSFMRKFPGEFRFTFAALGALAVWRERRVRVSVDDNVLVDGPMNLAAVANALYAGGGMMLSPSARNDDGLLDVVTASGLTRAGVIRELSRIHNGGHLANARVKVATGQMARIQTFLAKDAMPIEADGNLRGETPVQFQVLPRALRFVV